MKFVIYSGSYNIDSFGATSTVDNNILSELYNEGHDVTWIGFGEPNSKVKKIHLTRGKFFSLISKVIFKTLMLVFRGKNSRYNLNSYKRLIDYVYADSLCLRSIKKQNLQLDKDTLLICRNGMSLKTIRYFKLMKSQVIIRAQWMHPDEQNKLLKEEYKKQGIKNPILKLRKNRQKKEIKIADKIWCISNLVYNSFLTRDIDKSRLILVPLGVDLNKFSTVEKREDGIFRILFVGTVNPEKGIPILIQAILELKLTKIELILNGPIPYYFRRDYEVLISKCHKNDILVKLEPGDPTVNYQKSSIFVLPSNHESFGLVVLEAMATGLPVIVSSNVGSSDLVENTKNGFIFSSGDVEDLKRTINILYLNKELRDSMSEKSRTISELYSWKNITKTLVESLNSQ